MTWFKVDDNLAFHHKVVAAGNGALGLWVRAGAMCAQQLTDGFVPDHMAAALGTAAQAEKLVKTGLWDKVEGGYSFHEWMERQPLRAEIEAERSAAKERMRRARDAKKKGSSGTPPQVSEPRSPEQQEKFGRSSPDVRVTPTRPDPTRPLVPNGTSAAKADDDGKESTAQTFVAEWIENSPQRPPSRLIGQVARELKQLLVDGIPADQVRRGLIEWDRKSLHPSTLASVVHEHRPALRLATNGEPVIPFAPDDIR